MSANKDEFRAKLERLEVARQKAEAFVTAGGDLKSKEAEPVGLELVSAFADLARDFGYEIPEPVVQFKFTCECGRQLHVHGQHQVSFRGGGSHLITCPNCGKEHYVPTKPVRLFYVKEMLGDRRRWIEVDALCAMQHK